MYIKLLGFFLGFLITLLIINYITIEKTKIETFNTLNPVQLYNSDVSYRPTASTPAPTPAPTPASTPAPEIITNTGQDDLINAKLIPYKANKFMSINTFIDTELLSNEENRWYDIDIDKTKKREITENINHYFTFNNNINLISNEINKNGSSGANINSIQLNGPKSFYFATNRETNEVTEFTVIICGKIKDVKNKNNILFEMTGNTETINSQNLDYSQSIININLIKVPNGNFDIAITIGNVVYKGLISNIDKNTILMTDFTVLCLVYTPNEIIFFLNKQKFSYKNTETFKVKLGSTPVIINKDGNINMDLYNFIYYRNFIPLNEISKFTQNTYYYLSGLDFKNSQCQSNNQKTPLEEQVFLFENKIKELETQYINSLQQRTNELVNSKINKNELNIKPLTYNDTYYNKTLKEDSPDIKTVDIAAKGIKLPKEQSFKDKYLSWLF